MQRTDGGFAAGRRLLLAWLGSSACVAISPALAQQAASPSADIIVTATKRSERLQDVPISIQALGSVTLEQHQVQSFDDYAKLLPSVSFQSFGPGQSQIYFRGVTSGGDGLHGGSAPASGLYLDEIPLTTIANNIDIHVYDIERVEALSGPQGTLYGASSLSGTLRLITNKPDPSKFSAGYDLDGNKFGKGGVGGTAEGFVNVPLGEKAAIRLVGFYEHDGGYIDNTPATRTYTLNDDDPSTNVTINNDKYAKKNFNDVNTYGGRAALKLDLDDDWTVLPEIVYQHQVSHGAFLYDPKAGDLDVHDFTPDYNRDHWYQAALTIQGKLSDWDVTYAGGYFERTTENQTDYSYYTVAYDGGAHQGSFYYTYFPTANGGFLDPTEEQFLKDHYTKQSHELRVSSPADKPLRLTTGLFFERQTDEIAADYVIPGISGIPQDGFYFPTPIPGFGDSVFRTREFRVDRDFAAYGDVAYDITGNLTLDAGIRGFIASSRQVGFSGFAYNVEDPGCVPTAATDRPCTNINGKTDDAGETHKINLSWKFAPGKMVYATYSTGYRPGGLNRRAGIDSYKPDTLDNYELGWKFSLFDKALTFDGAVFIENWKKMQFGLSPIGENGITNIYNAGNARVHGIESSLDWRLGRHFELSGSGTYVDAKLTSNFCQFDASGNSVCLPGVAPAAPKGTRLPIQPRFKGTATARYNFMLGDAKAYVQASVLHQSSTRTFLTDLEYDLVGPTPAFTTADFAVGAEWKNTTFQFYIQNAFDERGELSRNTACAPAYCGPYYRVYPIKPQLFGIKFGQRF
jgi:outer membrane receptor protein involved in Fe transport